MSCILTQEPFFLDVVVVSSKPGDVSQQKNIGEEGDGKQSHRSNVPRKGSRPCIWLLITSQSSRLRSAF